MFSLNLRFSPLFLCSRLDCHLILVFSGLSFFASASQFTFFYTTGSEVDWDIATNLSGDREGIKLMLSGLVPFVCFCSALFVLSCLVSAPIITLMTWWTSSLSSVFSSYEPVDDISGSLSQSRSGKILRRLNATAITTLCVVVFTLFSLAFRPAIPYNHLTAALPFSVFMGLIPHYDHTQASDERFPFPQLLAKENWEPPREHFKGWAPGVHGQAHAGDPELLPEWAKVKLPEGFHRWVSPPDKDLDKPKTESGQRKSTPNNFYDPVTDPLRITNLDEDVLQPLKEALREHDAPISHVVMVMMESARKDIFPFQVGTHLYNEIMAAHNGEDSSIGDLHSKLARMTPNAEKLTGLKSGLDGNGDIVSSTDGGGVNVEGLITSSSFSCKSVLVNHCGASPLPIEWMGEVNHEIYQPCFNQILKLFNNLKGSASASSPLERKWRSFFIQSTTGGFGDQTKLMKQLGFDETMYREDVGIVTAKHYHSGMEKINYFG